MKRPCICPYWRKSHNMFLIFPTVAFGLINLALFLEVSWLDISAGVVITIQEK